MDNKREPFKALWIWTGSFRKSKSRCCKCKISYEALFSEGINNRVLNTVNLSQYASLLDENAYLSYSLYQGEESSIYKLDKDKFIKLASPK